MKVYLVKHDRSTGNGGNIELTVFSAYDKAYKKFKMLIAEEKKPENSWVGKLKWKNGVPWSNRVGFEFLERRSETDETECFWSITDTGKPGVYTCISIKIKEVLEK